MALDTFPPLLTVNPNLTDLEHRAGKYIGLLLIFAGSIVIKSKKKQKKLNR